MDARWSEMADSLKDVAAPLSWDFGEPGRGIEPLTCALRVRCSAG